MYFKRLEICGFKSFAEKTVLYFEPGVTAVVGPNGCGKSNIFDSIRWVLGEQSIKAMRAAAMEDVIFNGTASKPSLGLAEVSLTFSNEQRHLPLDYDEITVTRRLFRSGESEYLLNKSVVRLKDINELLMGTGIASESYSLIEQGKIDLVLSSRPEDRRVIFDEAAGITKYKSKKREALNKLKDTEDNLLRLNDIIVEVKRQIDSLERQAAKARRYQEQAEKLKVLEVKKAGGQVLRFQAELDELKEKKNSCQQDFSSLEIQIRDFKQALTKLLLERDEILSQIEGFRREALKSDSAAERLSDQLKVNAERVQEMKDRIDFLAEEMKVIDQRIEKTAPSLQALENELSCFDGYSNKQHQILKDCQEKLSDYQLKIQSCHDSIKQNRSQLLEIASNLTKARNDYMALSSEFSSLSTRKRRLQIELTKVDEEQFKAKADSEAISLKLSVELRELGFLKDELFKLNNDRQINQAKLQEVCAKIAELEKEQSNLESQAEFLKNLKLKNQDFQDCRKGDLYIEGLDLEAGMDILGKLEGLQHQSGQEARRFSCKLVVIDLDLVKIEARLTKLLSELKAFFLEKEALDNKLKQDDEQIHRVQTALKDREIGLANIQLQHEHAKEESEKLDEELAVVKLELDELEEELKKQTQIMQESALKVQELEDENKHVNEDVLTCQQSIAQLTQMREDTSVELAQAESKINSFGERKNSLESSLSFVQSSLKQDMSKKQECLNSLKDCESKIEQLSGQTEYIEQEISKANDQRQEFLSKAEGLESEKAQKLTLLKGQEQLLREKESGLENNRKASYDLNSLSQQLEYQILGVKNRIEANYQMSAEEFSTYLVSLDEATLQALEEEIEQARKKVQGYGAVNLVAIEEFEQLKQRYDFLLKQQQDLIMAKESVHKAIAKINQTTRKMFCETFEKIQEHFKSYFKLLFNGGDAQLFLTDETDPLESGIEIVCRPPGKKLQNISLLSGGEKSMSAIALIFAVFKVRPSPFCVLDEVDAALDESNIDRYNRVLQEFLKTTQFIIITHNKKTITNADAMYGITMQESGVSKIVSVKFAKDKKQTERTPETFGVRSAEAASEKPAESPVPEVNN